MLGGTFYRKVTLLNINGLGQSRCTFSHRGGSLCEKKKSYAHYASVFGRESILPKLEKRKFFSCKVKVMYQIKCSVSSADCKMVKSFRIIRNLNLVHRFMLICHKILRTRLFPLQVIIISNGRTY